VGARIYYLHFIIHDWPDSDCIKIMEKIRDAMTPGYSRLLLNDAVLPDMKRYVSFICRCEQRFTRTRSKLTSQIPAR
jgi:phosphoribulokinase